jgi:hypothetical protein
MSSGQIIFAMLMPGQMVKGKELLLNTVSNQYVTEQDSFNALPNKLHPFILPE